MMLALKKVAGLLLFSCCSGQLLLGMDPKQNEDLYTLLGVAKDAADRQIKKAYLRLTRDVHPDRTKDPSSADRFDKIHQAYELLSKPDQRTAYDRFLQQGGDFAAWKKEQSGKEAMARRQVDAAVQLALQKVEDCFQALFQSQRKLDARDDEEMTYLQALYRAGQGHAFWQVIQNCDPQHGNELTLVGTHQIFQANVHLPYLKGKHAGKTLLYHIIEEKDALALGGLLEIERLRIAYAEQLGFRVAQPLEVHTGYAGESPFTLLIRTADDPVFQKEAKKYNLHVHHFLQGAVLDNLM